MQRAACFPIAAASFVSVAIYFFALPPRTREACPLLPSLQRREHNQRTSHVSHPSVPPGRQAARRPAASHAHQVFLALGALVTPHCSPHHPRTSPVCRCRHHREWHHRHKCCLAPVKAPAWRFARIKPEGSRCRDAGSERGVLGGHGQGRSTHPPLFPLLHILLHPT